jgi:hypothetical protein
MPDNEYHSFSDEAVNNALEPARSLHADVNLREVAEIPTLASPTSLLAECISVTINNNRVCLNLPLGLPRICLPIPIHIPDGSVAQACLRICTFFGIPTGACVSIVVAGQTVASQCFGFGC